MNTYGYVLGNPVSNIDPKGLLTQCKSGLGLLKGVQIGPIHHEFSCFKDASGNTLCRGFGRDPKSDPFDAVTNIVPGIVLKDVENFNTAHDRFQDNTCTPDDKNVCMDRCVGDFYLGLERDTPGYSWTRKQANQCKETNTNIVEQCKQKCGVK